MPRCGQRLRLRGTPSLSESSLLPHRQSPSGITTQGGPGWPFKMVCTARQLTLSPQRALLSGSLENKHPQASPPALPLGPVPPPLSLSEAVVLKAVRSFPGGSAPGPSGLRPSHLREAVSCPAPDRARLVLKSLTIFVNALAAGRTPPSVLPHLCGATLLAGRRMGDCGPSLLERCCVD